MANETLKVVAGNAAGSSISLDNELVIGRSTPGLGSLGGDSEISRVHARVYNDPSGQLMVEDLGSTNGTFVNGARVTGSQPLRSGDQLRVGQTTMSVEGGAADAGATSVGAVIPPAAAATPPPPAAVAATPPTQQFPPAQPQGPPPPPTGGPGYAGGPIGGPPGKKTGGPNKGLLIGLAVLIVAALVVGGLAIGGVFDGKEKASKSASATTGNTATSTAPTTPTTPPTTPTEAMPDPQEAMPEPPSDTDTGGGSDYPPAIEAQFLKACNSNGRLSSSGCQCWFDSLKEQYTYPEFIQALSESKNGSPPPEVLSALRECASA